MTYDEILTKLYKDHEQAIKRKDEHYRSYLYAPGFSRAESFHIDMVQFYFEECDAIANQIIRVSALRGEA